MLTKGKALSILGVFTVMVMFSSLAMAATLPTHTITVTQGDNGKITPAPLSGAVAVPEGKNKLFTITPKAHYHVTSITLTGVDPVDIDNPDGVILKKVGNVYKYLFTDVRTDDLRITATYAIDTFALNVSSTGSGTGTIEGSSINDLPEDPKDIDCPGDCDEIYDYGTSVTLTAAADPGSIFEGWSGACKGKSATCTTKVTKANTAVAKFTKTYTLSVTINGTGSVKAPKGLGSGFTCTTGTCTEVYKDQNVVTLVAKPGAGIVFSGWEGDASGTVKSVKVTMADSDKNITAKFGFTGDGMKIVEKVSVVDTSEGTGMRPVNMGRYGIPDFPTDSDYNKDQTQVWVNERSAETFGTINEILCMIGQTKYDAMLNQGYYKAQIDQNLCSSDKDDPSAAGESSQNQSSGSTMPKYRMWTVSSSRTDDNSPQILKAWIHEPQEAGQKEPGRTIFAKVVITSPVTETNPYGIFTLYWQTNAEVDGVTTTFQMGNGLMRTEIDPDTGKVLLKFVDVEDFNLPNNMGRVTYIQKATLDREADGSSGAGTAYHYGDDPFKDEPEEETFDFAFNPTNFKRTDGVTPMCLDRTDFDETAWRYSLYTSEGSRVNRSSGFSIKVNQGGRDYYGWIGYYGVWFPSEVTLQNGDPVYKQEFGPGGGSGELYNVLISGGKLKKHVRKEMTLGAVKNVPLDYWDNTEQKNYRAKWNGTNFVKYEWLNQAGNYMWEKLEPTVNLDLSDLQWNMLSFWSQSLGGNVQINLPGCTPTGYRFDCSASANDSLPVVFYAESIMFPGDTVPTTFACFNNCPDVAKLNNDNPSPYNNDFNQPQPVAFGAIRFLYFRQRKYGSEICRKPRCHSFKLYLSVRSHERAPL